MTYDKDITSTIFKPADPLTNMGSSSSTQKSGSPETDASKPSMYRRFKDSKASRSGEISDEDMLKYTGKTKAEVKDWSKDAPGVAGNQAAGKLSVGGTTGLCGMAAAEGYGGWGPNAGAEPKYPPEQGQKG